MFGRYCVIRSGLMNVCLLASFFHTHCPFCSLFFYFSHITGSHPRLQQCLPLSLSLTKPAFVHFFVHFLSQLHRVVSKASAMPCLPFSVTHAAHSLRFLYFKGTHPRLWQRNAPSFQLCIIHVQRHVLTLLWVIRLQRQQQQRQVRLKKKNEAAKGSCCFKRQSAALHYLLL